jgi:hypothetical protein
MTDNGGRCGSLQNVVFERDALGVVLLELPFGGFLIGEYLDVVNVADFLRCVDVNEHGHWSLFSLRRPPMMGPTVRIELVSRPVQAKSSSSVSSSHSRICAEAIVRFGR